MLKIFALLGTLFVAALMTTTPAAVAASITVIDVDQSGKILAGVPSRSVQYQGSTQSLTGYDGINAVTIGLPRGTAGKDFTLVATGGTPGASGKVDFDIKWTDYNGAVVWTSSVGNEAGKVPAGATARGMQTATIVLMDGADATFHFVVSHVEEIS